MVLTEEERKERRRETLKRWNASEKARVSKKKYKETEKGKIAELKYRNTERARIVKNTAYNKRTKKQWYKAIVKDSKYSDIYLNRVWNQEGYITPDFVKFLNQQQEGKCIYCQVKMLYGEGQARNVPDGLSIQRMDNSIGHMKSNCVLSCLKCNQ